MGEIVLGKTGVSKREKSVGAVKGTPAKKTTGERKVSSGFKMAKQSSNLKSRPNKGRRTGKTIKSRPGS